MATLSELLAAQSQISSPAQNFNQGVNAFMGHLAKQNLVKQTMQDELALATAKAKAEQQVKSDVIGENIKRAVALRQQYPDMFGIQQSMPTYESAGAGGAPNADGGKSFNPIKTPNPFVMTIDPTTGNLKQVVNPEYSLYRSQELAKLRNEMQPESADAANAIAYRNSLLQNMNEIKTIVEQPGFNWGSFGAARVSRDNPSFTSFLPQFGTNTSTDDMMKIHNALQFIKKTAFGEGGKTLTDTEKQLVYSVLQPQGMKVQDWLGNLKKAHETLTEKSKLLSRKKGSIDTAITSTEVDKNLDSQINQMLDMIEAQ